MLIFPSAPQDAAAPCADDVPDPSILRAERRLRLLEELAEIGMDLARGLRAADRAEAARGKSRDPADAYGPLSRAIRLTLALEARTDAELRDLKAGVAQAREEERAEGAERARRAAVKARDDRVNHVRDLVMKVAETDVEDTDDFFEVDDVLEERLDEYENEFGRLDRPLRETVEGLCKAMGLSPDWSRWNGADWVGEPFRPFVYMPKPSGPALAEAAIPPPIDTVLAPAGDPPPPPPTPPSPIAGVPAPAAIPPRPGPPMPPWRLELELERERLERARDLE
jgi:hypothetical protein